MKIINSNEKVSNNFTMLEFYRASSPVHEFDFPKCLIESAQILRDWFEKEIIITSTSKPSDTFGFHRVNKAIDFISIKDKNKLLSNFKTECENYATGKGSVLIDKLRSIGVTGFGIENVCIHLDCRDNSTNKTDKYGSYMIFIFEMKDGKILINKSL